MNRFFGKSAVLRSVLIGSATALALFVSKPDVLRAQSNAKQAPKAATKQKALTAKSTGAPATHQALLNQYCVGCHNQKLKTANLMFDTLDFGHLAENAGVWEKVVRKLRSGMMPPPGTPRPPAAAVENMVSYLETSLDAAAAANPNPGTVTLHRLNRAEYANAVRELFGIDVDAAALLPTDDISDGFDNIAKVLKVSPSFIDQYIMAARAVTKQAIGEPPPAGPTLVSLRTTNVDNVFGPGGLPLGARSGTLVEHPFPYDGDYEFRGNAGSILTLDGVKIEPNVRIHVTAGLHKVGMAAGGRSFAESESLFQSFIPANGGGGFGGAPAAGGGGGRGGRGGGAAGGLQVNGPFNPTGLLFDTLNRQKVFICHPPAAAEEASCANRIFANIARKAFRRPVTEKDLAAPMQFFKQGRENSSFEAAIQGGLLTILSSPKFLYRAELPSATAKPGSNYRISDLELASRLSFFLWSGLPDDALLAVAEQGKLKDPMVLKQQVQRMLADPRSKTLVTNFGFEWLKVRDITVEPDPIIYPQYDNSLKTAFRREMEMFLDSVFREDRSVVDLLAANYTFVNERLAAHYGIPNVRGDQFRKVILPDERRWGLLGKGAVLMVTSYPNRTAPVLRGAWILENITGTPPSPPPPNVEAFKENKEGEKALTVRQIMEQHRANPTCNACHGIMDPLGFALENFDSVGMWRDKDRYARTVIDAAGKLVDGTPVTGPADLRKALLKRPEPFVQTITEKLLMYSIGRGMEPSDMPAVRKIVRDSAKDQYKFSSILMGIVTSAPFQMRHVPIPTAGPVAETKSATTTTVAARGK